MLPCAVKSGGAKRCAPPKSAASKAAYGSASHPCGICQAAHILPCRAVTASRTSAALCFTAREKEHAPPIGEENTAAYGSIIAPSARAAAQRKAACPTLSPYSFCGAVFKNNGCAPSAAMPQKISLPSRPRARRCKSSSPVSTSETASRKSLEKEGCRSYSFCCAKTGEKETSTRGGAARSGGTVHSTRKTPPCQSIRLALSSPCAVFKASCIAPSPLLHTTPGALPAPSSRYCFSPQKISSEKSSRQIHIVP